MGVLCVVCVVCVLLCVVCCVNAFVWFVCDVMRGVVWFVLWCGCCLCVFVSRIVCVLLYDSVSVCVVVFVCV